MIKIDQLMLWAGNEAVTDILNDCQELIDDFVDRFKKRNCLNSDEIEEMFCYWDSLKLWNQEEKK